MGFFVHWCCLVALSCLLCMAGEVFCDCTEDNMQIAGGDYKLTNKLERGSMLIYSCPEGYYPYPAMSRVCQANGQWKPRHKRFLPQRCRLVECPDPSVLEYGDVFPPQEKYFVNNETTYECYTGYTLRGSSRRVCLPNGKWSGSTPICSRDIIAAGSTCADPGIPAGGSRMGNVFGVNDTVKFSCSPNMFLVGSSERVCQKNGWWTGTEPTCYYKHTYDTSMEVAEVFGRAIKESLMKSQPDDKEEGRKIKISKNETLNIYIAVDISESMEENHIANARNAVLQLIKKIASFTTTPNYEIVFFSCEVFEVVNILDSLDGRLTLTDIQSKIEQFSATDKGTLETDLNFVFKTFLEKMLVIKQRVGEEAFKEHRHTFIIFTDGGYTMGDPAPTVKSIKDTVYMGLTSEETQAREEYLDIYIFGTGSEIFDEELQALTVGTGGRHYFRMKDIQNLQETFDEIIDEEDVMGLCGLHTEYDTGLRSGKRNMYPWITSVVRQVNISAFHFLFFSDLLHACKVDRMHLTDFFPKLLLLLLFSVISTWCCLCVKTASSCFITTMLYLIYPPLKTLKNEGLTKKCLGSLVSPDFVLTAAHCFLFGDLPEHVTVEIDDGHGKVKSVKTLHIHPNYNLKAKVNQGVQEFYDYDVALIQLETSVHISRSVRPICIPCTQETSHALKLVGSSSCREQEQKLLKTAVEEFSFLTRTSNLFDRKDVFAKLGDNRPECIRHALQAPGVTTHNPEDVVTANFLCTGGLTPFRDHIACAGDAGGAVFKDFEHRTIQVAVVSWGNKQMCIGGGLMESDSTSRDFHFSLFRAIPFLKSILGNDLQDDYAPLRFLDN